MLYFKNCDLSALEITLTPSKIAFNPINKVPMVSTSNEGLKRDERGTVANTIERVPYI